MDPRAARPGSAVITLLIIYEKNGAELGDPFSAIVCSQEVGSCLLLIFFYLRRISSRMPNIYLERHRSV